MNAALYYTSGVVQLLWKIRRMDPKSKQKQFTLAEAKRIGDKLGIDWAIVDIKQFRLGMNTEAAVGAYNPITEFATDDPILIGKLVRTHLHESPDYYTRWIQDEKEAEVALARKQALRWSLSDMSWPQLLDDRYILLR